MSFNPVLAIDQYVTVAGTWRCADGDGLMQITLGNRGRDHRDLVLIDQPQPLDDVDGRDLYLDFMLRQRWAARQAEDVVHQAALDPLIRPVRSPLAS